jgi:hypothetical protein
MAYAAQKSGSSAETVERRNEIPKEKISTRRTMASIHGRLHVGAAEVDQYGGIGDCYTRSYMTNEWDNQVYR